jgi:putative peptidoglycan lipid II flippase
VVLGHFFAAAGVAASLAGGAWSSALSLIRRGAMTFGFSIDAAARRRLPRIAGAALVMGGLLWLATGLVLAPASQAHGIAQAMLLAILITGGLAVYGLVLTLSGVTGWRDTIGAIRQTPRPATCAPKASVANDGAKQASCVKCDNGIR